MVVTNTLEAIAGSMLIFFKVMGTTIPNKPATIIVIIMDIEIINESKLSWNHNWTINALITAKIIPFKIPILNSLRIFCVKLFLVKSFVAKVLTVTAKVCAQKLVAKKIPKSYFTKMSKTNVILNALIRKTQLRLIDSNRQSNELANEISILLDQLDSKSPPKKNLLEERIKNIRVNINKIQNSIET